MNDNKSVTDSQQLNPLSQTARIKAQQAAKAAVLTLAGDKPKRSDFDNVTASKYPNWLIGVVLGFCVLMLIAAFIPSSIRLYDIGNNSFSIDDHNSRIAAGICIILLAEIGSVLFTLTLAVMDTLSATGKRILLASAVASAVIALLGNYFVALHERQPNLFEICEALLPPILTLSTSYILKEVSLKAIERRFADNQAFEHAMKAWEHETGDPDKHPQYLQYLANELRDAIWKANRAKKAREYMGALSGGEWSKLVWAELAKDNWYSSQTPNQRPPKREWDNSQRSQSPNSQLGMGNGDPNSPNAHPNGNGNLSGNYKVGASEQAELFFRENPDALYWKEHDLVAAIGVSKGTVGAVRKRLLNEIGAQEN